MRLSLFDYWTLFSTSLRIELISTERSTCLVFSCAYELYTLSMFGVLFFLADSIGLYCIRFLNELRASY